MQNLIIGGGFSGMAAAIELRKRGMAVDLVEIDPGWRSYGAGISLGGATLRAFGTLGIFEEFLKQGSGTDYADLYTPGGQHLVALPTPRIAVENSSRLGELEICGGDKAEQQRILGASMAALAAPI